MNRYALRVFMLAAIAVCGSAAEKRAFIEPAQPKWGDNVRIVYRADLAGSKIRADEMAAARVTIWYPGRVEQRRVVLTAAEGRLTAQMAIPDQASFISCEFVSKDNYGGSAQTMIYRPDGQPARGAWHQSMFSPSMQKDYRERAARELALYPDNWAVYRDKWFSAGAFDAAEREGMIRGDLPVIERGAAGRPLGALYSLHYGHLLLGEEAAARDALREMVRRFPDEQLTANALSSYEYENLVRHFAGDGPKEVRPWSVDYARRNPQALMARQALTSVGSQDIPVDVAEAICRAWMRDQPEDPQPYMLLAQYYHRAGGRAGEALPLAEKGLDLMAAGQLRLHGDVYGKLTSLLLPGTYITASKLALEVGQPAKALAYAKAAQNIGTQTLAAPYAEEARVWERLGREPSAAAAYKEAWKRGDQAAYKVLAEKYPDALKDDAPAATSKVKPAPAFHGTTLDGAAIDSAKLRGKVIVANFWFTGCGPCKAEMPDLNRLTREFAGKDVVFLAFTFNQDEAVLRRFLKEYPFEYTIVPGAGDVAAAFGIESYPSHVIVSAEGTIESMLVGAGPNRAEELRAILARLVR